GGRAVGRLDAGHDRLYSPDVRVRHMVDPTVRPSSRIYYTFTRNAVWVALRSYRARAAAASITRDLLLMAFTAARAGELAAWARGVADAGGGSGGAWGTRGRMTPGPGQGWARIRAQKPSVRARAVRHARERLI